MKVWPRQKRYICYSSDGRIVAATEYSLKFYASDCYCRSGGVNQLSRREYVPQAIAIAGFFLSLLL